MQPTESAWFTSSVEETNLFEGVGAAEYNGIWGVWKLASLGLFGAFVVCAIDIAISMRRRVGR